MTPLRVLQFGVNGQVGGALLARRPDDVEHIALSRADADLADIASVVRAIEAHKPDIVINAAAYTAVDQAERDRDAAFAVNAAAPEAMARALAHQGGALIHVSTDYVFDGEKPTPYVETDATAPVNAYGESKLAGEEAVLATLGRSAVLRTSWVYAPYGRNFFTTMLRLGAERDAISVVDDQIGAPTPAADIAEAIWRMAAAIGEGAQSWGVYHFTAAGETSWAGFADAIFDAAQSARARPVINRITTNDYPTPARRPKNSRLDCALIEQTFGVQPRDWREALRDAALELEAAGGT